VTAWINEVDVARCADVDEANSVLEARKIAVDEAKFTLATRLVAVVEASCAARSVISIWSVGFNETTIMPGVVFAYDSNARPMTRPDFVAFIPIPGCDDAAM
jgi:hypothetical protein